MCDDPSIINYASAIITTRYCALAWYNLWEDDAYEVRHCSLLSHALVSQMVEPLRYDLWAVAGLGTIQATPSLSLSSLSNCRPKD